MYAVMEKRCKNVNDWHTSCNQPNNLVFFACNQTEYTENTRLLSGYPKLLVVSPKTTVGWIRGLTEILQNQLWDGIVGYSIKKW